MLELVVSMVRPEARRRVPAQRLHTVEQVHHGAHEERADAQSEQRAENAFGRVPDRKRLSPQCPVRGK